MCQSLETQGRPFTGVLQEWGCFKGRGFKAMLRIPASREARILVSTYTSLGLTETSRTQLHTFVSVMISADLAGEAVNRERML